MTFKGRNRYHSFTFKEYGNGARLDNGVLVLSKIGRISVHWSRPLEGTPKTITVSKEADGWYVAISCADVPVHALLSTGQETGIDLGLESFATLANGAAHLHPSLLSQSRSLSAPLPAARRPAQEGQPPPTQSRRPLGQSASAHRHGSGATSTTRKRSKLVQAYDVIYHEDLRVANMVKNHHLAKSISDAGWSAFLTILAFKAASAGKRVVAVNPAFTSQRCSGPGCGAIVSKGLSVRWHLCPECGTSLHRDHNAALNILRLGHGKVQ